jgi:outer membrane protein assembly factor BamB
LTFEAEFCIRILLIKKLFWRTVMKMRKLFLGFLACVVLTSYCYTAHAADWPNWRGPDYNGISSETGWTTNWPNGKPAVLWRADVGTGFSSISVSNGRAYTMGNINDRDILYCFDAATGKKIWEQSYDCPLFKKNHEGGPCGTPTVEGNAIYTFSKNGDALRFAADTGRIVWRKNLHREYNYEHPTWHFSSSPVVVDNMVILNAGSNGIALNKNDGSLIWQNGNDVSGYASAVPYTQAGKKCVVMATKDELVSLDTATGRIVWKYPWRTRYDINAADAVILGDEIFISSGYNKGCALLKINGNDVTELWRNSHMRNQLNSSVIWQGHVYGFDGQVGGGGQLRCVNYEDGEVKWAQRGLGTGSLMLADGKLIILSERGKLVIASASPDQYTELASAQILTGKCWTVPVLSNGRLYARNADGNLVCVDLKSEG